MSKMYHDYSGMSMRIIGLCTKIGGIVLSVRFCRRFDCTACPAHKKERGYGNQSMDQQVWCQSIGR